MGSRIPMHGTTKLSPCVLTALWLIEHCYWHMADDLVRVWSVEGTWISPGVGHRA